MSDTRIKTVPMDDQDWNKLGVQKEGASLFTPITLAQGEVLNIMESRKEVTLTHVINQLNFPEPIIMMSIGGLIKEGLIDAKRRNKFVLLTEKN